MFSVRMITIGQVKPNPHNARTHSKRQIRDIANSITAFGFATPVLVDESFELIAGHGRLAAAKLLGHGEIPTIVLTGLSAAKKRALALADNKIAEHAGWDRERLAVELPVLTELLRVEDLDIAITGFGAVEIEQITTDFDDDRGDPADEVHPSLLQQPITSKLGDLWQLGKHRLLCGSALDRDDLDRLMGMERASVAFLDPPYNVSVGSIVGRGQIKHAEFAMASGEMSQAEFESFLRDALCVAASFSVDGAVHYVCMDWRHIGELLRAGAEHYHAILNLVVWDKTNAGQGSFYRSQHELIAVFRNGKSPHLNNVELGKHGRNRSNVWRYAGVNTFRRGRMDDLAAHPTVKPVAMIADALKDCSRRGDLVLDTFCGSGSTILAAERVGRQARAIELEPRYVDAAVRRWQALTRKDAVNAATGLTFDETAELAHAERAELTGILQQGGSDVA